MIVSRFYARLTDAVDAIINALANRLTAGDNFGPEGQKGQVLTSNGPRDIDTPPSYQWLADIPGGITQGPKGDKGDIGLTGPQGPAGTSGGGGVPLHIADGDTFEVPDNVQMVFAAPIAIDGELLLNGVLIMVD